MQIWQGMGGKRPRELKNIESLLWQLIKYLAQSPCGDTVGVLKTCFGQIYGVIGEGVNVADIDWFDSGEGFQSSSWRRFFNEETSPCGTGYNEHR
jgi:hypothetical protein